MSCLVAYVSGHGLGHAAREVEILRRLSEEIPLVIKTRSPEWFWREEMGRAFEYVADSYDVGCVQPNSLETDLGGTLAAWQAIDRQNRARADSEAADLEARGARLVVSDVPSFPLTVAARVGVPSVCIANFTWADIYSEYVEAELGFGPVVAQLTEEYRAATLLFEAGFAQPMPYFGRRESIGVVARAGRERRAELLPHLGDAAQGKRLALVYAGNWGLPLPWEQLERFRDWHFFTLGPPPAPLPNFTEGKREWMPHPDLVASVDLVVSKPGYGLVGECFAGGTPLLFCPRQGFAEYAVLERELQRWPGGLRLSAEQFLSADWQGALDAVPFFGTIPPQTMTGGEKAAAHLRRLWEQSK